MKFLRFLHSHLNTVTASRNPTGSPGADNSEKSEDFKCLYAEYVCALAQANVMLQRHGMTAPQFAEADVASMRLFHRLKRLQGMGKPRMA